MQLLKVNLNFLKHWLLLIMMELVVRSFPMKHHFLVFLALGEIEEQTLFINELILRTLFVHHDLGRGLSGSSRHLSADKVLWLRVHDLAVAIRWKMMHNQVSVMEQAVIEWLLVFVLPIEIITPSLFVGC